MRPNLPPALRIERLRAPAALLLAFLQRTPAVRTAIEAGGYVLDSQAGSLIKAAAASLAALGAIDSVAGATTYTLNTGSPGHPSPYTVTQGSQIAAVAFALSSVPATAAPPGSWTISGPIPPGLVFGSMSQPVTSPGTFVGSNPTLTGTPTTPGDYTMILTAWESSDGTSEGPNTSSTPFS